MSYLRTLPWALPFLAAACAGASHPSNYGAQPPIDSGVAARADAGLSADAAASLVPPPPSAPPSGSASSPPPPPKTAISCPSDMRAVAGFCMDTYEAPNRKGAMPLTFWTAHDGEKWCQSRKKRLCTENEWNRACGGAEGWKRPYGDDYEPGKCNDNKRWIAPSWEKLGKRDEAQAEVKRLFQADPSGSRKGCKSDDGVMDLVGNAAEWVRRSLPNKYNHDHVVKGCFWAGCFGGAKASCTFRNPAHPGSFRSYEIGFRCCKDGDSVSP